MKRGALVALLLLALVVTGCGGGKATPEAATTGGESTSTVGEVKLNPHPTSLEGKTVLLRWNGKPNGDNYLNRVAELLTEQVPGVKIVKLYELDETTATTAENAEQSQKIVDAIASHNPDLVIASQAD